MDTRPCISVPAASIPVSKSVDVVVLGAGPAGCAAAIMAARTGASTLLIDSLNVPGGMSTTGMMSHYTGTVDSRLYEEVLHENALKNHFHRGERTVHIDPSQHILTWIEMLEQAGAEMLMYTFAAEPIMDGDVIKGVIVQNKSGRSAILAKVVIDATGDGDIAALAGAEFYMGREGDASMQPATLMFKVAGVDMERAVFPGSFETTVDTPKGELQKLASELLPHPAGHVLLYKSPIPGVVTVNMTNVINIDGTKAEDLTRAEIVCRKQMPAIVSFLREYVPGYENCYAIAAASLMGVRETRHFKGLYTLTKEDILERRVFDDWVVRGAEFNFDVHNMTGGSLDATGVQKHFPKNTKYTIPYRCLIPEKVRGLLLAGRNISGTHMAHSNYRVMPICIAMGEGAGIAAALAAMRGVDVRDVSAAEIQQRLI
ncbi:MAG: FAD-dependent oxidoreductase [Candidatus Fimadaptatus sp.]|jgi:hypothetical protein